jgi:SOS-response transcriptional repressor LexA
MSYGLTKKQNDLLRYLMAREAAGQIAPSYQEMMETLGLRSKSGVHRLVLALEERGHIRRIPNRARVIELLTLPENIITLYLAAELNEKVNNIASRTGMTRSETLSAMARYVTDHWLTTFCRKYNSERVA